MPGSRRRQIIHTSTPEPEVVQEDVSPGGSGEVPYQPFEPPRESLLSKTVYVTLPMMLTGIVAVMVLSFLATYVIVRWPAGAPELAENPAIAELRAELAADTVAPREAHLARAEEALAPRTGFNARGGPIRSAGVTPETLAERPFTSSTAAAAGNPLAAIGPASRRSAAIAAAAGALQESAAVPGQQLLMRRFAKAPGRPQAGQGVSSLAVAGNAGAVQPRTKQFARALGAGAPTADVAPPGFAAAFDLQASAVPSEVLMRRRFANAPARPAREGAQEPLEKEAAVPGTRTFVRPAALDELAPASDLEPGRFAAGFAATAAAVPGQRLALLRYPKETLWPARDDDANPLLDVATGAPLKTRERTFARALNLDGPVAEIGFASGRFATTIAPANVPGQRFLQRRYAKVVTNPEREIPGAIPDIAPTQQAGEGEAWQRYAARVPDGIEGKGRIVIIIDDMGNNSIMAKRLSELPGPLNFAFLPYAPSLESQTAMMRAQGHELLVHLPMEPEGNEAPGPHALLTSETEAEIAAELDWNLTRFAGFVGVNNHMGSMFTADRGRMETVIKALKARGLLFLDSLTSPDSKGRELARLYDLPWAGRDVFIDNEVDEGKILAQLREVERIAKARGYAIAIGHPHGATYRILKDWIETLEDKGLVLVPLSSVVHTPGGLKLANREPAPGAD